ncbi:NAD(P)H-dependent oxidoreductase [Rugamonas sp.]|uniref:FMN-dependent NADH-azoreductase n=1 Tax=Rugamonas sp. TaxID=1926287 RepID=UPI0025F0F429|nr:NAD(P)H-dependent oxidoreductase [Rugamonas sp.]
MNILHIDSCALGDHSTSRRASATVVASLQETSPRARVVYRDLAAAPLSHVSGPLLRVMRKEWDTAIPMNAELSAEALLSDVLLSEFQEADVLVMSSPMHNLSIPSTLKVWLDRLLQTGCTYEIGADGPRGLVKGKRIVIVTTRGCPFVSAAPDLLMDHQENYLTTLFNFMGVQDISIIRTEADFDTAQLRHLALQRQLHAA